MHTAVVQGFGDAGQNVNPVDNVKKRYTRSAKENNIPTDMFIDVKQNGNIITARVVYTKQV